MAELPGGNPEKRAEEKFTRPRDIAVLISKVHPDRIRVRTGDDVSERVQTSTEHDTPEYWSAELVKILSGLMATEQTSEWQPDLKVKIIKGEHPDVRMVRKLGDILEMSEPVRLPRIARAFLLALDAYVNGESWDEVLQFLTTEAGGVDRAKVEAVEVEIVEARTYEQMGAVAQKIQSSFPEGTQRNSMMGLLVAMLKENLSQRIARYSSLSELAHEQDELTKFFRTAGGKLFRKSTILDVLDAYAIELAKKQLTDAITQEQVSRAVQAFQTYPFGFAFVYEQPFSETRDDALAKIELLSKLRGKRSEAGLDELIQEVRAHQFQSTALAPKYRQQIINFIERKRGVYWPRKPRKYMPQP